MLTQVFLQPQVKEVTQIIYRVSAPHIIMLVAFPISLIFQKDWIPLPEFQCRLNKNSLYFLVCIYLIFEMLKEFLIAPFFLCYLFQAIGTSGFWISTIFQNQETKPFKNYAWVAVVPPAITDVGWHETQAKKGKESLKCTSGWEAKE